MLKRKSLKAFCASLFLTAASNYCYADLLVSKYEEIKDHVSTQLYVLGLGDAYGWTNTQLEDQGRSPLFCVPDRLGLGKENYVDILEDEIIRVAKTGNETDFPVALMLLHGLIYTFPCN